MVLLVPVPAIEPGLIVQLPAGNPFKITLPVAIVHEGCVIVPIIGATGVAGCGFITILAEAAEVHPCDTVNVYVPATKPEIVVLALLPVIAPGLIVQLPAGKPVNVTLPVAMEQVGCVIVPTIGADGIVGCVLITIFVDGVEVHPEALVTE